MKTLQEFLKEENFLDKFVERKYHLFEKGDFDGEFSIYAEFWRGLKKVVRYTWFSDIHKPTLKKVSANNFSNLQNISEKEAKKMIDEKEKDGVKGRTISWDDFQKFIKKAEDNETEIIKRRETKKKQRKK